MLANLIGGEPSFLMDAAAIICGVALLYLVIMRTIKKRDAE